MANKSLHVLEQPEKKHNEKVLGQVLHREQFRIGPFPSGRGWRDISPLDKDLALLASSVCYADRCFRRAARGHKWGRRIDIKLPVFEPNLWFSVRNSLQRILYILTGDCWEFEFYGSLGEPQRTFGIISGPTEFPSTTVMSFSNGLDSFLGQARLYSPGKKRLLLVGTKHNYSPQPYVPLSREQDRALIEIPARISGGVKRRESSYRSRSFLFFVNAFIVARLSGAEEFVISENGVGSLGPWLIPVGVEHPYFGTHPYFTSALMGFLKDLYKTQKLPQAQHPWIWLTKGQMLQHFLEHGGDGQELRKTRSCSHNYKRHKGISWGDSPQCGICSGCILSRLSLHTNALDAWLDSELFLWNDLRAVSLEKSLSPPALKQGVKVSTNDEDIAVHAVRSHIQLACVKPSSISEYKVRQVAEPLGLSCAKTQDLFGDLLGAYHQEWSDFVSDLGDSSWIKHMAGDLT